MKRCSELDDFDAFDMKESRSSWVDDESMEERRNSESEPCICCICNQNISLTLKACRAFPHSHITQLSAIQRNSHVSLCLSRQEAKQSGKKTVTEYFSKKRSSVAKEAATLPSFYIAEEPPVAVKGKKAKQEEPFNEQFSIKVRSVPRFLNR